MYGVDRGRYPLQSAPQNSNFSTWAGDSDGFSRVALWTLVLSLLGSIPLAQAQQPASSLPAQPMQSLISSDAAPPALGSITGTVVDKDGAVISNAKIVLSQNGAVSAESQSAGDGTFTFSGVTAGPFELKCTAPGFADQVNSGVLAAGQYYIAPAIEMKVATTVEVSVTQTQEEIAEQQIHVEEQQRLLGVIPNFYVSYLPDAEPLTKKQKFELGWRSVIDPVSFGLSGVVAGIQQADNAFSGYGQGAQGYGKRLGANYADLVSGTFIGGVILPSVLKQDPRYFYKGTGGWKSRFLYAVANAVICKGDNGHWQPNYSNVLGDLAAGGLSNLYYPASNRGGVGLTFENTLLGIGGSAVGGVFEEFFSHRMTPHAPKPQPDQN